MIPSSRSAIFSQRARHDYEIPKSRATCAIDASRLRATAITSRRNSGGNGLGTMLILPARPKPHRQGVNSTGGSPHSGAWLSHGRKCWQGAWTGRRSPTWPLATEAPAVVRARSDCFPRRHPMEWVTHSQVCEGSRKSVALRTLPGGYLQLVSQGAAGSRTSKRQPPLTLAALIRPPWASTMPRAMASPSPLP